MLAEAKNLLEKKLDVWYNDIYWWCATLTVSLESTPSVMDIFQIHFREG